MNKSSIFFGLLICIFGQSTQAMEKHGFFLPTSFHLETALDKISVRNICQTLTFAAGIAMLYKAGDLWAKTYLQPLPTEGDGTLIQRGRSRASLRYLIAGCAFTAAGFLQKYGSQLLQQLPKLKQRFFRQ